MLWAKGYTELLDRLNEHVQRTGQQVEVDVYGSGPDLRVGTCSFPSSVERVATREWDVGETGVMGASPNASPGLARTVCND